MVNLRPQSLPFRNLTISAARIRYPLQMVWVFRQYESNLRLLADAAPDVGATPILLTQARLVTAENGAMERERIRHDSVHLSHDALVRAFEDCDRAVLAVAEAEDVPMLDLGSVGGATYSRIMRIPRRRAAKRSRRQRLSSWQA